MLLTRNMSSEEVLQCLLRMQVYGHAIGDKIAVTVYSE
jgi:hypothetical protein